MSQQQMIPETRMSMIERAKTKDADRAELYVAYVAVISRWCLEFGLSREDAEDLSQELASLELFRKLHAYDPKLGRFRAWLKTVVRRYVIDHWRGETRRRDLLRDFWQIALALALNGDTLRDDPDQLLHPLRPFIEEVIARVRKRVHPDTWEAFDRVDLQGQQIAVVAEGMGVKPNSVIKSIGRVRKHLLDEATELRLDAQRDGKDLLAGGTGRYAEDMKLWLGTQEGKEHQNVK